MFMYFPRDYYSWLVPTIWNNLNNSKKLDGEREMDQLFENFSILKLVETLSDLGCLSDS